MIADPEAGHLRVSVRAATLADIVSILRIERQSPEASHWSAAEYDRILAEELLLVAEVEGDIAGFLCARLAAEDWELENIAVAGTYRRQGVARELLEGLLSRIHSGSAIFLEVRESNHAARRFYEKRGFIEAGRRRRYYQQPEEDAVVYELRVASGE